MVSRQDRADTGSEFEAELRDFEGSQRESEVPARGERPGFRDDESSHIPEDSPGVSFEEFMEKEGQSLESEVPVSEEVTAGELEPLDEELPEQGKAEETEPSPSAESPEVSETRRDGVSETNRSRLILPLVSGAAGAIVAVLILGLVTVLSGSTFWSRVSSQSANMELLENRLNERISLLQGGYEELGARVTRIEAGHERLGAQVTRVVQVYQGFDGWVAQAEKRIGELEERVTKTAEFRGAVAKPGQATQKEPVAQAKGQYHEIQPGDTLSGVAKKYGISLDELRRLNNLTKEQTIYPGQKLLVASGN
jgi:LysM repeat protein